MQVYNFYHHFSVLVQFDTALTDRVWKGQGKYLSGLKRKRTLCLFVYKTTAQLLDYSLHDTERSWNPGRSYSVRARRAFSYTKARETRVRFPQRSRLKYTAVSFAAQLGGRPLTFKWGIGKNFSYPKQITHTSSSPPPLPFLKSQIVGPLWIAVTEIRNPRSK